ncbi:MAG: aminoglycoside 3'-phosphotransferase [Deltaproteobacteria bacterium]|nr:MAG: aminoglycoside 3'-phosphotransferase [Deltaproteobacteria bacterium]
MIPKLPSELELFFGKYEWKKPSTGESGDKVYQINCKNGKSYFLKTAIGSNQSNLVFEKQALAWMKNKFLAPSVVKFLKKPDATYLLTTALEGHNASRFTTLNIPEADMMKLLAKTLRKIHQIPIDNCNLDQGLATRIPQAKKRWELALIDKNISDPYESLIQKCNFKEDQVFTHGDYCLANIIIGKNNSTGLIDLGRAGVSDRYQDISLLFRSFEYYTGKRLDDIFVSEYGLIDYLDQEKIEFYQLLDSFF